MTDVDLYFRFRCQKGLKERGLCEKQGYKERLEHEINTIISMGFSGYFLVVSDLVRWAITHNIPVGPGRGSAGGSLVSYVLEITHLDPVKYGLIFERFLNPERVSMPDIDLDFCKQKRSEVIEYVCNKYGKDCVAHIGTYGTMKARAAIRAANRTLGYEIPLGDKLANFILPPIEGKAQPLETCYEKVTELRNIRNGERSREREVLEWAERFEDRISQFGTHASGIVISDTPIDTMIPLYMTKDGVPATQFEMNTVEERGLIKFDILGLDALTTIDRCVKSVAKRHGITINPLQIPVDDQKVYQKLQGGDVDGIFQIEGSTGIRDLLVQIRPTELDDLATLVAIYRPGPLGSDMLKNYLAVRAGTTTPSYYTDALEPILAPTGGMLIFQEQILEICKQLAGYTLGEADLMRRAVGKKKEKEMAAQEAKFKQGMTANGFGPAIYNQLWDDIKTFASYGFNKSHAACYGYISYQMAYLKTYYPLEFMCSCLVTDSGNEDKIIKYINYCRANNINILPPSINESEAVFAIANDNKSIRFGLGAIKNVGKAVEYIILERETNGPFKNLIDFTTRLAGVINRKHLESLVLAGAMDAFGCTRASLIQGIENIYQYRTAKDSYDSRVNTYEKRVKEYETRQSAIQRWESMSKEEQKEAKALGQKKPGCVKIPVKPEEPALPIIPVVQEIELKDLLRNERDLLGYYVSGHPLDSAPQRAQNTIAEVKEITSVTRRGFSTSLIAIPATFEERTSKKTKKKFAHVVLEDKTGTIEGVIFPDQYMKFGKLIDITVPARYDVNVELIEGDEKSITKVIIDKVHALQLITPTKREEELDITIPMEHAKEAACQIKSLQGNDTRLTLRLSAPSGTIWNVGTFKCSGSGKHIESVLRG